MSFIAKIVTVFKEHRAEKKSRRITAARKKIDSMTKPYQLINQQESCYLDWNNHREAPGQCLGGKSAYGRHLRSR